MSLISKVAKFASSPQGRRAIKQARARLDTPENRQRVTEAVGKVRAGAKAARTTDGSKSPSSRSATPGDGPARP